MNIFILTGPIESGKTTALHHWCGARRDVRGILMPGSAAERCFLDLSSGESWPAAVTPGTAGAIPVGRYTFSAEAFARAEALLLESANKNAPWLVVDEIGKLELSGAGFDRALRSNLAAMAAGTGPEALLLVVRDELLEAVRGRYRLAGALAVRHPSELPPALPNS